MSATMQLLGHTVHCVAKRRRGLSLQRNSQTCFNWLETRKEQVKSTLVAHEAAPMQVYRSDVPIKAFFVESPFPS